MPTLLRHHCRLDLSSHRTTCGIIADLWLTATFPILWDLAASFDEAVRDQNLSLFLRHHRRLVAASSPTFICAHRRLRHHCRLYHAASWKAVQDHYKVFLAASCRLSFALTGACNFIVILQHHCRSLRNSCRLVANCHFPTPVGSCCFMESSVRPLQGLSCGIMPTFISAHRRLRFHCRLTTSLSFIAALMPTCG
jgi:hypothetical protein